LGFYFLVATNAKDTLLVHVIDDTVDDTPANEIQLCNRRRDAHEFDPFRTTKRIKKLFRIAIQR
jgi:hypothetical protein